MSKRRPGWWMVMSAVCLCLGGGTASGETFRIYWVDVEGGAATLLVSPTGESLLVDTGWIPTTTGTRIGLPPRSGTRG